MQMPRLGKDWALGDRAMNVAGASNHRYSSKRYTTGRQMTRTDARCCCVWEDSRPNRWPCELKRSGACPWILRCTFDDERERNARDECWWWMTKGQMHGVLCRRERKSVGWGCPRDENPCWGSGRVEISQTMGWTCWSDYFRCSDDPKKAWKPG